MAREFYNRCEFCGGEEVEIDSNLYECIECGQIHGHIGNKATMDDKWKDDNLFRKSPCTKDCPYRVVGCHDWCEDYNNFRAWKELEANRHKHEWDINNYIHQEIIKNKKRYRRW